MPLYQDATLLLGAILWFIAVSCGYGGFLKKGYHIGGPYSKDYSILGSILGSHYFGKLPIKGAKAAVQD